MKKIYILAVILICNTGDTFAQNVGIGTTTPVHKLDVAGRLRIRHTPGETAGLWLDGDINTKIGFMGVYNNNTLGFYGSVSGWQLVMNTVNGNVGIGTTAPTASLDVDGELRLRGSSPANGATMVSKDGNGNATWQRASAFRADGLVDFTDVNLAANANVKINFHYVPVYNIGVTYNGQTSTFTAPVKGVYFLSSHLESFPNASITGSVTVQLMRTRNNISTIISRAHNGVYISGDITAYKPEMTQAIAGDFLLEAGDQVWVKVAVGSSHRFFGSSNYCSFSGHLVAQQF